MFINDLILPLPLLCIFLLSLVYLVHSRTAFFHNFRFSFTQRNVVTPLIILPPTIISKSRRYVSVPSRYFANFQSPQKKNNSWAIRFRKLCKWIVFKKSPLEAPISTRTQMARLHSYWDYLKNSFPDTNEQFLDYLKESRRKNVFDKKVIRRGVFSSRSSLINLWRSKAEHQRYTQYWTWVNSLDNRKPEQGKSPFRDEDQRGR